MTDLGDLNYFLGLEVHRQNGNYSISQERYIKRVAELDLRKPKGTSDSG